MDWRRPQRGAVTRPRLHSECKARAGSLGASASSRVGGQRRCLRVVSGTAWLHRRAGLSGWAARPRTARSFTARWGAGERRPAGGGVNAGTRGLGLAVGQGGGATPGRKYGATWQRRGRAAAGCGGRRRVQGWRPSASVAPQRVATSREKKSGRRGCGAGGGAGEGRPRKGPRVWRRRRRRQVSAGAGVRGAGRGPAVGGPCRLSPAGGSGAPGRAPPVAV